VKARYKRQGSRDKTRDIHRKLMESHLGRRLGRFEFVHHKNGNRFDNALENLQLVTPKLHAIIHNQKHPITKVCRICGIEFNPHPTHRRRAKTCSVQCGREYLSRLYRNPDAHKSMYRVDAYPSEIKARCIGSKRLSENAAPANQPSCRQKTGPCEPGPGLGAADSVCGEPVA